METIDTATGLRQQCRALIPGYSGIETGFEDYSDEDIAMLRWDIAGFLRSILRGRQPLVGMIDPASEQGQQLTTFLSEVALDEDPTPAYRERTNRAIEESLRLLNCSSRQLERTDIPDATPMYISERAEQSVVNTQKPHLASTEAALYKLLTLTESEQIALGFETIYGPDGVTPIALLDSTLIRDEFINTVIEQRSLAFEKATRVVEKLEKAGIPELATFKTLRLPVVLLNVDALDDRRNDHFASLGVSIDDVKEALEESPNWKASEHALLFSRMDQDHDYRSYAVETAGVLGMDLKAFLLKQQVHEANHPVIDYLQSLLVPGLGSTWLTEGFAELAAEFSERAEYMALQDAEQVANSSSYFSVEDVLRSSNSTRRYSGGYCLLKAIGITLQQHDAIEGVGVFFSKLLKEKEYNLVWEQFAVKKRSKRNPTTPEEALYRLAAHYLRRYENIHTQDRLTLDGIDYNYAVA